MTSDEYSAHAAAIAVAFGEPAGRRPMGSGRQPDLPERRSPEGLTYATVHKEREWCCVVAVERQMIFGTEAALGAHESTTQWLLDVGAAIDARDDSGRTALWDTCSRKGGEAVVRLLLAQGADVDIRNSVYGMPPLLMAIRSGSLGSVVALLEAGAEPRNPDARTGLSPLDYAVHKKLPEIQAVLQRAIDGHGPGPALA